MDPATRLFYFAIITLCSAFILGMLFIPLLGDFAQDFHDFVDGVRSGGRSY